MKAKTASKKIRQIIMPLILALVFILSLIFDKKIMSAIQSARTYPLDSFFSVFLFIEKDIIFYSLIIILAVIIFAYKNKKAIFPFLVGAAIAMLISFLLKKTISRERPFANEFDSFPSGHATAAFTPLSFFSKGIGIIWFVFACLLACTRLWFGIHYLSDLIAGAAIGYYVPVFISHISKKWKKRVSS